MTFVGVDDLAQCIQISRQRGIWRAWREIYYTKYEAVFSLLFKQLYRCGVDDLKSEVESFDFEQALNNANRFLLAGGISFTEELIAESQKRCPFDRDIEVYLLIGLGTIERASLTSDPPFLYLGLERFEDIARTGILVPYEYSHIVRTWSVYRGSLEEADFTLGDAVISEGLAVMFASLISGESAPGVDTLMMPEADLSWCEAHREELVDEINMHWNDLFTGETAEMYMSGRSVWKDGRPGRTGYYVGAQMVKGALSWAYGIGDLTKMSADRIRQIYRE